MSRPMAEIAQRPTRLLEDSPEAQASYDRLSGFSRWIVYGLLILGAVVMVLPFVWMVSSACKPQAEINTIPVYFIPQNISCAQNVNALYETSEDFNRNLLNTAIMTVGRT